MFSSLASAAVSFQLNEPVIAISPSTTAIFRCISAPDPRGFVRTSVIPAASMASSPTFHSWCEFFSSTATRTSTPRCLSSMSFAMTFSRRML